MNIYLIIIIIGRVGPATAASATTGEGARRTLRCRNATDIKWQRGIHHTSVDLICRRHLFSSTFDSRVKLDFSIIKISFVSHVRNVF